MTQGSAAQPPELDDIEVLRALVRSDSELEQAARVAQTAQVLMDEGSLSLPAAGVEQLRVLFDAVPLAPSMDLVAQFPELFPVADLADLAVKASRVIRILHIVLPNPPLKH